MYDGRIISEKEAISLRNLALVKLKEGHERETEINYKNMFYALLLMVALVLVAVPQANAAVSYYQFNQSIDTTYNIPRVISWEYLVTATHILYNISGVTSAGDANTKAYLYDTTGLAASTTCPTIASNKIVECTLTNGACDFNSTSGVNLTIGRTYAIGHGDNDASADSHSAGYKNSGLTWPRVLPYGNITNAFQFIASGTPSTDCYSSTGTADYIIPSFTLGVGIDTPVPVNVSVPVFVAPTPANGTSNTTQITINMTSNSSGVRFYLYLANTTNFTASHLVLTNTTNSTYTSAFANVNMTYYYLAYAWNSTNGNSANTTVRQYSFIATPPTPANATNQTGMFYIDLTDSNSVSLFIGLYVLIMVLLFFGLIVNIGGMYNVLLVVYLVMNLVLLFNGFIPALSIALLSLSVALMFTWRTE